MLERFLEQEDRKLEEEIVWLRSNGVDCVLSDAAYLPWLVAVGARLISALTHKHQ